MRRPVHEPAAGSAVRNRSTRLRRWPRRSRIRRWPAAIFSSSPRLRLRRASSRDSFRDSPASGTSCCGWRRRRACRRCWRSSRGYRRQRKSRRKSRSQNLTRSHMRVQRVMFIVLALVAGSRLASAQTSAPLARFITDLIAAGARVDSTASVELGDFLVAQAPWRIARAAQSGDWLPDGDEPVRHGSRNLEASFESVPTQHGFGPVLHHPARRASAAAGRACRSTIRTCRSAGSMASA